MLTTIRAVHRLSAAQAARGYPVHVRGVIVYYDPFLNYPRRPIVMVDDGTATIYTALPGLTDLPLKAGTLLDVTGRSGPGDFAPIIDKASIRILGQGPLPAHPYTPTLAHLLSGTEDAEWAEMEGVIESVDVSGNNITFKLALRDGEMAATTVKEPGADYDRFIDAKVRIRGVAGSLFNRRSQIVGVQLLFPGLATLNVEEPAPQRPFELPISPISDLMRYAPNRVFSHRVHVRGSVTLLWPGRLICIQDGTGSLCADTAQTAPALPGDKADLIGFPLIGSVTPTLNHAVYQSLPGPRPLKVSIIDASHAIDGSHDAQLVQMEGQLVAHDRTSHDPMIVVASGTFTYQAILPATSDTRALLALEPGSKLRITGICSVQADSRVFTRHDGYPVAKYFQIMLRSANDVVILERPSWWNARHTLYVLALALAATMGVLGWVVFLRMRVKQQTALLQHQATHDGLTGMWNRKAVLDLLQREFEIASRAHTNIGVMMLDADHFKQINDTHGHLAGDAVLRELARRIQSSLRSSDLTGRYGGEEFLVVLPGCTLEQVSSCAERIRSTIADQPIDAESAPLAVTVSIGTSILAPTLNSPTDALSKADEALYQAKRMGRNRVIASSFKQPKHQTPSASGEIPIPVS
jgi:diguanylate cyclase (GGDEF)-like protein